MTMAMKQTESIKFGEFLSGEYKRKGKTEKQRHGAKMKAVMKTAVGIPVVGHLITSRASASAPEVVMVGAIPDGMKEKIVHAFDPLVELMVGLSVPIAGVMITGGALMVMIGQKDLGFKLIMNSALGYVIVQMVPMFMELLIGIGNAV